MRTPLRVAVVGGGTGCEHEVSLGSAVAVVRALRDGGHEPVALTIDRQGCWRDRGGRPLGLTGALSVLGSCDVVVPMVHGAGGEDGTLAALLDLAGLPYVGSGVRAGALAMDKWATKLLAGALGVATAPGVLVTARDGESLSWTHPVVVKPVSAGSSHGVTLVDRPQALRPALDAAFALDPRVLVEDVVMGREVDVAVLGRPDGSRLVAPLLEVVRDGIFGLTEKYDGTADLRVPAAFGDAEVRALEDAALTVYDGLGCAGVARVDFFLTDAGPVLNEVNTVPGFTEQSQVPRMFAAGGLDYPRLVDVLVRDAVRPAAAVVA